MTISKKRNGTPIHSLLLDANLNQLRYVLKNIKRGKNYLLTLLGHEHFYALLKEGKIESKNSYLYADKEEKSGSALRITFTIVTSGIGIWMGLADFLSAGHRNWHQFILISALSFAVGAAIGIFSYRSAAHQAKEAVLEKNLTDLQIILIKKMREITENRIEKIKEKLHENLAELDDKLIVNHFISFFDSDNKKELAEKGKYILLTLRKKIKNDFSGLSSRDLPLQYMASLIFNALKKLIRDNIKRIKNKFPSNRPLNKKNNLQRLFEEPVHLVTKLNFLSWSIRFSRGIFLEATPVILGSFGAVFLFLNGVPDTLKKLGWAGSFDQFNQPWPQRYVKLIHLCWGKVIHCVHRNFKNDKSIKFFLA